MEDTNRTIARVSDLETRSGYPTGDGAGADSSVESQRREGFASARAAEPNRLLAMLSAEDSSELLPQLRPVRLRLKQLLVEADEPITDVYFIREGVASVIAHADEDAELEVGIIGKEGFVGLPLLFDVDSMPNRVIAQVEGDAWRLSAKAFLGMLDERPAFRKACLRYAQYFTVQIGQSVACNRLHTLEERCARWLLMTLERIEGDSFEMTHEFLSIMLGVRRAGVTVAMGTLQSAGILRYTRGRVSILDARRLQEASCGCYGLTRTWLEQLVGPAAA